MENLHELEIGRIGEYMALADLLSKGIPVFETAQGMKYDLIAEVKGKLLRIQVKTTKKRRVTVRKGNPIYFFNLKRAGKGSRKIYGPNEFDAFALVCLETKDIAYVPFNEKVKANSICLRDIDSDYSGHRGGGRPSNFYWQNLTWENFLKNYEL